MIQLTTRQAVTIRDRVMLLAILLLLLCGLPAAPVHAQSSDGAPAPAGPTLVLRPGDVLRITVWRNLELTGEFPISGDGTLAHPLYREVVVAGLDLRGAEARIRELLARLEANPRFVVEPLLRVAVGGEVRQPGLYTLSPETSLAEAVALAGGATDRGRLDRVRLFRDGQETRLDLTDPRAGIASTPVRSGDQIYVQRRASIFRDYIAPAGGITAAVVSLLNLMLR